MWTLVILFLYPHVGTATTMEFYNKTACLKAKETIDARLSEMRTSVGQIEAICIYQGGD